MLELDDIALIPSELNNGNVMQSKFNYGVQDVEPSLPIFTSPMESIVGKENWRVWQENGIKPVIPRTESLEIRLEACCFIFAAFSKDEVRQNFLMSNRRSINSAFRICIDAGNGHDSKVLALGKELRRVYGGQVLIMGGNIGNPKTYVDYCKAEFDYVRVGLNNCSLVDSGKFGFYYPLASFLIDLEAVRKTSAIGLKQTKVIVDGGITCQSDILKCIALGADYVMIGREFARLVESNGEIYKEVYDNKTKSKILEPQPKSNLVSMSSESLKRLQLIRVYRGNTSKELQSLRGGYENVAEWEADPKSKKRPSDAGTVNVSVTNTLGNWLKDMYECFNYAFTMTSSTDWKTFKNNAKYIQI